MPVFSYLLLFSILACAPTGFVLGLVLKRLWLVLPLSILPVLVPAVPWCLSVASQVHEAGGAISWGSEGASPSSVMGVFKLGVGWVLSGAILGWPSGLFSWLLVLGFKRFMKWL